MIINRALIPSMILSVSLVAGGCNNKTKSQEAQLSVPEIDMAFAAPASNQDFERLLTVERRKVTSADAKTALAKLGLGDVQDGPFKWESKSSNSGDVTYDNLAVTGKDGEDIKIRALTLTGAHMNGDDPSFDRIELSGLTIVDEDTVVSVDGLSLARPTPALGASIMRAVEIIQTSGDFGKNIKLEDEDIGFGALLIDNLTVTAEDAVVTLSSAGWGEDETTGKAMFLLEDIKVTASEKNEKPAVNIALGSLSATGIDMGAIRNMREASNEDDINLARKNFNIFSPVLDGFSLQDFNLSMDSLTLNAPAIESVAERKGDITTITQKMSPVTIGFSEQPTEEGLVEAWNALKAAGYEQIEISGSSVTKLNEADDSFSIEDGFFSLKNGFDLNFSSKGHGLKAINAGTAADNTEDAINAMTFDELNISLKDRSIVDRAIAIGVEKQGIPEVFVRMLVKGSIMAGGAIAAQEADTPAQEAAISDMVNALGGFIDNGGTISIGMSPAAPLTVAELKDTKPQSLDPERLGLTITHEK